MFFGGFFRERGRKDGREAPRLWRVGGGFLVFSLSYIICDLSRDAGLQGIRVSSELVAVKA